jgi:hypothetical protein
MHAAMTYKLAKAQAATAAARPVPGRRRAELDIMRALVVAGLVVFHSAMVFAVGNALVCQ